MRALKLAINVARLPIRSVSWSAASLALVLVMAPVASARANEVALFAEALIVLRQAETAEPSARGPLLSDARDRLQRIVALYPASALARQLQGTGVPVMGGSTVSLSDVRAAAQEMECFARPTKECLPAAAALAAARSPPAQRAGLLVILAEAQSRAGLMRDATQMMGLAMAAAEAIPRPGDPEQSSDRDFAFAAVAMAQARAGLLSPALVTVRQIAVPSRRAEPLLAIADAQGRLGQIDEAQAIARMFAEGPSRARALVPVAGALARSLRFQEAFATAEAARPDPVAHVMALALIAEAQRRAGNMVASAEATFVQATSAARAIPEQYARVLALCMIAQAQARTGGRTTAATIFAEAKAVAGEISEPDVAESVFFYLTAGSQGSALAEIAEAEVEAGFVENAEATAVGIARRNFSRALAFRRVVAGYVDLGRLDAASAALQRLDTEFRAGAIPALAGGLARAGQVEEAVASLQRLPARFTRERLQTMVDVAFGIERAQRLAEAATLRPHVQTPATPLAAPAAAVLIEPVRGTAQVLSTANLLVGVRAVTLAHVEGLDGAHARSIAAFIVSRGGTVSCEPVPPAAGMRCRTEDGVDLAEAALFNGGARIKGDAPANYRTVELAAQQARRGVWAERAR